MLSIPKTNKKKIIYNLSPSHLSKKNARTENQIFQANCTVSQKCPNGKLETESESIKRNKAKQAKY